MTEEEPLYFYKMMMTEGQHSDLLAVICSYRVSTTNENEIKLLEKLVLAVVCATKEARE